MPLNFIAHTAVRSASGQTLPVMTLRESQGMLHEVWVLTDIEAKLYPATPSYSSAAQ